MSPPTRLALCRSMAAGLWTARAMTRSRKPGANRSTWFSIAAVMSTVEPLGRWQYAHSTCRPAGALDGEHVRPLGVPAGRDRRLPGRDLVEGPAQVDGRRGRHRRVAPRHRAVKRPVELERAGTVPVPAQPPGVPGGQPVTADVGDLPGGEVEEDGRRPRQ